MLPHSAITCHRSWSFWKTIIVECTEHMLKYIYQRDRQERKKKKKPVSSCTTLRLNKWIRAKTVSPWIYLNSGLDTAATFKADDTNCSYFWVWSRGSWQISFQVVHIRLPVKHKKWLPEYDQRGCFSLMASFQGPTWDVFNLFALCN